MKKKYRNITVESRKYAWMVKPDDDGGHNLTIWYNKVIVNDSHIPAEFEEITPKLVSDIIKCL